MTIYYDFDIVNTPKALYKVIISILIDNCDFIKVK